MHSKAFLAALLAPASVSAVPNDLAVRAGLKFFGTALGEGEINSDAQYAAILGDKTEFGLLGPENVQKWDATEPSRGSFSFSQGDITANTAKKNGQMFRCHTLVWYRWVVGPRQDPPPSASRSRTRSSTSGTPACRPRARRSRSRAATTPASSARCLDTAGCAGITLWGFTDTPSWIPNTFAGEGAALLYEASFNKRPVWTSVSSVPAAKATGLPRASSSCSTSSSSTTLVTVASTTPTSTAGSSSTTTTTTTTDKPSTYQLRKRSSCPGALGPMQGNRLDWSNDVPEPVYVPEAERLVLAVPLRGRAWWLSRVFGPGFGNA